MPKIDLDEIETRLMAKAYAMQAMLAERRAALDGEAAEWGVAVREVGQAKCGNALPLLVQEMRKRKGEIASLLDREHIVVEMESNAIIVARGLPAVKRGAMVTFMSSSDKSGFLEWDDAPSRPNQQAPASTTILPAAAPPAPFAETAPEAVQPQPPAPVAEGVTS